MTISKSFARATASLLVLEAVCAFAPQSVVQSRSATTPLRMVEPTAVMDVASTFVSNPSMVMESASSVLEGVSSNLLAFADQGQNLAGIFFQASLLPYLLFLYFLSFRANRISDLGNFGFQFILLFVASTIPSGIISKATYGTSLANVDWLHGGAEALLTIANIMIVLGFKEAMSQPEQQPYGRNRNLALGAFWNLYCLYGPGAQHWIWGSLAIPLRSWRPSSGYGSVIAVGLASRAGKCPVHSNLDNSFLLCF